MIRVFGHQMPRLGNTGYSFGVIRALQFQCTDWRDEKPVKDEDGETRDTVLYPNVKLIDIVYTAHIYHEFKHP